MTTYLEERIEWYDENYRAGRALISNEQFDQLEKNLLRIDPKCDYFNKKKSYFYLHYQKTKSNNF